MSHGFQHDFHPVLFQFEPARACATACSGLHGQANQVWSISPKDYTTVPQECVEGTNIWYVGGGELYEGVIQPPENTPVVDNGNRKVYIVALPTAEGYVHFSKVWVAKEPADGGQQEQELPADGGESLEDSQCSCYVEKVIEWLNKLSVDAQENNISLVKNLKRRSASWVTLRTSLPKSSA